jgi:hypothetical protein
MASRAAWPVDSVSGFTRIPLALVNVGSCIFTATAFAHCSIRKARKKHCHRDDVTRILAIADAAAATESG